MAMASRSSVRAFLAEQGGRSSGRQRACGCELICARQAQGGGAFVRTRRRGSRPRRGGGDKEDLLSKGEKVSPLSTEEGLTGKGHTGGNDTETEADSSSGLRRRRRAARLDIAGDRSGVVMPVDRVGEQSRPGAKREAGASQGDNRFMTRSIKWSGITKRRWV